MTPLDTMATDGTVRPEPGPPPVEERRRTLRTGRADALTVLAAAGGALAFTALVFGQLAPFSGLLGFMALGYVTFLALYTILVWLDEDGPAVRDRLATVVIGSLGLLMLSVLVLVVGSVVWSGRAALVHLNFYTDDMSGVGPLSPLTKGGVLHAVVGTLEQVGIALAITVPAGVLGAVCLNEIPGGFSRFIRTVVEAMTALPSIVAGLFVYASAILALGLPRSGFAAALALSVMMLPIIVRAADVVLRLVPGTLREASLALGAPQWRTVWHVVLPTARSGLTTAVILGTARGVGETSPVLLTSGFTLNLVADPFGGGWQVSLPLQAFTFVRYAQDTMVARGFGTAAALMALVLLLFVLARLIGGRAPGDLTAGQRRRRAYASRRDEIRMAREPR